MSDGSLDKNLKFLSRYGGDAKRMMKPIEVVTIPKSEYEELKERDAFLTKLEEAGVDNWEGMQHLN